jgi:aminoglycoside phosphotransferase (APT) family kinase protein
MARFWAPEVHVSEELARELISTQFPELGPQTVHRFGAGMDNAAFLVNDRYVFRFPRREMAVPLLECETKILPVLAPRVTVAVPVPAFAGTANERFPWTFAGYEVLPGTSACSVSLSTEEREALATALGSFLRELHSIDPAIAIDRGLRGDLIRRLDHTHRFALAQERFALLEDAGAVANTQPFVDFMASVAPEPEDVEPSVIAHGDLYARHILVDERHALSAIIDWGDLHYGHPAVDLMVAHSMLPVCAHDAFIAAYGEVDTRTWELAKYRATYHCALVANFGIQIGDAALWDAGLTGLRFIRETL